MTLRLRTLLIFLVLVVAVNVGRELYDWRAYAEERTQLVGVRSRLLDAGADVVRTRARLDTLRTVIEGEDRKLEQERRALRAYGRKADGGALPPHLYEAYRVDLERYNEHVARRNESFQEWEAVIARNHAAVDRYNALADTLRALAGVMGEPYYPVPSPIEAAEERGLIQLEP